MLEALDAKEMGAAMAALLAFSAGIGRWWRVERLHAANNKSSIEAIGLWKDLADRAMAQVDAANARATAAELRTDSVLEQARKDREEDRKRISDLSDSVRQQSKEINRLTHENKRLTSTVEQLQAIVGHRRKDDPPADKSGPIGLVGSTT